MPPRKRTPGKSAAPIPVQSVHHLAAKRSNIPTADLQSFVADDEKSPKTVEYPRPLLYPRDPDADPQLVWRGKDDQDAEPLTVASVPVYIQEKIEPQALIENLRDTAGGGAAEPELTLFDDFDGLNFTELVDFYQHNANWSNRLVLGDSLLVMTSLAEKEALAGKVQMIYMDPPYGIKFNSNWQVSTRKREVQDSKQADLTRQPEQIRAFRDTWKRGVHSFLAYVRERLVVAHDLLNESGSVFVQIGDENVHLVRSVLDEVFGGENFISLITFAKTSGATGEFLGGVSDYLLWYGKDRSQTKYRQLYLEKFLGGSGAGEYNWVELADGTRRGLTAAERAGAETLPADARLFRFDNLTSASIGREKGEGAASWFAVSLEGKEYRPASNRRWSTNEDGMERLRLAGRLHPRANSVAYVRYLDDFPAYPISDLWTDTVIAGRPGEKVYVVQTSPKVVERCLLMTTDPGDLVLDPTSGSGTTAFVAEQHGRRWIAIDTSRVAMTLARTRLMSARFPHYLLRDSTEGAAKESELTGYYVEPTSGHDVRRGFVYKRIPHVSLKSIAQNPAIKDGMTRDQVRRLIEQHADQELLYAQPYEDARRVRVAGPFTVESLAPHRVIDPDEDRPVSQQTAEGELSEGYEQTILENLRKGGVQNTVKSERLVFDRLEAFAGSWLQAAGEYTTEDGLTRRVAVSLGPQYGTVGPDQIKEAAIEAVRGAGFDMLLVLGFAFDARAAEIAKEFTPAEEGTFSTQAELKMGRLPVSLVRMNPDLVMGDALLKNTGAGNLFMVFGEPDVEMRRADQPNHLQVEIHGVDVFDPTTGTVRSHSTDDIACWFIDTNYNSESFFVRHAYFTGADEPYKRLQQALRAEIDEDVWASMYSTVSRPFLKPTTGKIAVKVINHFGDEVLKVYEVGG
ncbi:adenine-specific DNA-methyltransferase [Micromonospora kangleipakensis]|uniref:Adenine-specific DNA-methyltransferase n=1 Tax=Micromonospora kangleipakensis TaxID=1077942 RepID=A0A4Q8BHV3_9ACTN|nr:site-specific DNA-methyltransferase [Micromonospora kangleipakensis]RZU77622.1 adenine-specific DNA-methyltransferase [Micromonospora kangleipakensis]